MATKFKLKRSTIGGIVPTTGDIDTAELAVNLADKKLYTSNGTVVFEIGSNLTNLSVSGNLTINTIIANGSIGTAGQVLHSNGTSVYWDTDDQGVTSVASGVGLSGGTITTTGTISVVANTGLVANATGVYVNATYIGTISANNASFLGGTAAASYVQNTDSRTLSGNLVFTGANVFLQSASLGGTATNFVNNFIINTNLGNASYLRFHHYRHTTGADWTGASTRIQQRIDVTDMGYLEFNPSGYPQGIGLYGASGSGLVVSETGNVVTTTNTVTIGTASYFVSNGNVGIGTSSPGAKLAVSDGTVTTITLPFGAGATGYFGNFTNHALAFLTNNLERMRITDNGDVGIGTTSPAGKVGVERASGSAGWAYHFKATGVANDSGFFMTASNNTEMVLRDASGNLSLIINSGNNLSFFTAGTERARITSVGDFLVGRTAPINGHCLQSAGGSDTYRTTDNAGFGVHHFYSDVGGFSLKAYVQADGNYTNLSDARFKTDITPARSYLKDLMSVEVVTYRWKGSADGSKRLGVIAQQVEQVFPSLVKEVVSNPASGETQKMLPNEAFIPMLITAVQELTAKLEAAEARIATLENK
jgi:hypothetical protein